MKYLLQFVRLSMFANKGGAASALRGIHRVPRPVGSANGSNTGAQHAESHPRDRAPHVSPGPHGRGEPLLSERAREELRRTLKEADAAWSAKAPY